MDIVGQLQEGMRRFSAQESRVATFILQNLSFTASASIDELAASAGVSPATITRFARSVGCDDIRDLRKQLAQASERRASWLTPDSAALPVAWRDKLGAQDVTLAALLQHQLLPSGIAINLCQDAALMRLTASTLNDDHLLLVLATAEANPVLQSATLQARTQGVTIIALTPEQHALGDMASAILPLPADPQQARYALLLLVDLLNDTLIA